MKILFFICLLSAWVLITFFNFLNDYFSGFSLQANIAGMLIVLPAIVLSAGWAMTYATLTGLFLYAVVPQYYFLHVLLFCAVAWIAHKQRSYLKANQDLEMTVLSVFCMFLLSIGQYVLFFRFKWSLAVLSEVGGSLLLSLLFICCLSHLYFEFMRFSFKLWGIPEQMFLGEGEHKTFGQ